MKKYLLTLLNIFLGLGIWIGPGLYYGSPFPAFFTWAVALYVYISLQEIVEEKF